MLANSLVLLFFWLTIQLDHNSDENCHKLKVYQSLIRFNLHNIIKVFAKAVSPSKLNLDLHVVQPVNCISELHTSACHVVFVSSSINTHPHTLMISVHVRNFINL